MNIEDLISQYIDGDLSSEAEAELHHRLAVSPESRALFRAQIALRSMARSRQLLHQPTEKMRSHLFERLQQKEGMKRVVGSSSSALAATLPHSIPSDTRSRRTRRRLIPVLLPFLLGVIVSGTFWLLRDKTSEHVPGQIASSSVERKPSSSNESLPQSGGSSSMLEDKVQSDAAVASKPTSSEPSKPIASAHHRVLSHRATVSSTMSGELALSDYSSSPTESKMTDQSLKENEQIRSDRGRVAMKSGAADGEGGGQSLGASLMKPSSDSVAQSSGNDLLAAETKFGDSQSKPVEHDEASQKSEAPAPQVMADPPPSSINSVSNAQPLTIAPVSIQGTTSEQQAKLALIAGLQQNLTVGVSSSEVRPELALKIGAEFAGGTQQIYAMGGRSNYREGSSVASATYSYDPAQKQDTQLLDTSYQSSSTTKYEFWGGIGYRINGTLSEKWKTGGGVWAGVGSSYFRMGAELPISYQLVKGLRLELLPTIQYTHLRSGSVASSATRAISQGKTGTEEVNTTTTTVPNDGEVQAGVGIGISIILP